MKTIVMFYNRFDCLDLEGLADSIEEDANSENMLVKSIIPVSMKDIPTTSNMGETHNEEGWLVVFEKA